MATAICQNPECGHEWELSKPADQYESGPRCSQCGSTEVEVEGGPRFSKTIRKETARVERLRESLADVPGVGEAKVEYAANWFERDPDLRNDPEELVDLLAGIEGVPQDAARRVTRYVFSDQEGGDRDPLGVGDEAEAPAGGESDLDSIIKAKRAGLLGDEGGSDEVAEALETLGQQVSQTNRLVANALADDESEDRIEELKAEIEDLKRSREDRRLSQLEKKIEEESGYRLSEGEIPEDRDVAELVVGDRAVSRLADRIPRLEVSDLKELVGMMQYGPAPPGPGGPGHVPTSIGPEQAAPNQPGGNLPGEAPQAEQHQPGAGRAAEEEANEVWRNLTGEEPEATADEEAEGVSVTEALDG